MITLFVFMLIAHGELQSMGVELQAVTEGQPNIE
jgi:hypothetical protein